MNEERVHTEFSSEDILRLIAVADATVGDDPISIYTVLAVATETVLLTLPPDIRREMRKQMRAKIPPVAKRALEELLETGAVVRPN